MFLTDISLKRPVFAKVIIIAMLAFGVVGYMGLPLEMQPDVDMPTINIAVSEYGVAPDQIESNVTKVVEDAVGQISGIQHINSTITQGLSVTTVTFDIDKPSGEATQDVKDQISNIRGSLPTDINEPVVSKYDASAAPVVSLAVTGSKSVKEMSQLVEDNISEQLQAIKGVGAINIYGEQEREIHLNLDKAKMNAYNVTLSDISNSLGSNNVNASSGRISNDDTQIGLKTNASIQNVNDFLTIPVLKRNDSEVKLGDIATVEDGSKEQDSLSYYNGQEAIGIDILKQSGSNTVEVADSVKSSIESINKTLPSGVTINFVNDGSTPIRQAVDDVQKAILEGCILAVLVIFVFLMDFASTAISAISLPVSIITTFAVMSLMHFTLNIVSLMALSIAVGLLSDDSIVVIENIVRHLRMGKSPLQAAKDGASEIGLAVLASSLALVAVFLPIAMASGIIGKFMVQFGITVSASILISLFISFTLVPLFSSKHIKTEEARIPLIGGVLKRFNNSFVKLSDFYSRFLKVSLNHKAITMMVPVVLLVASFLLVPMLNTGFIATSDNGEVDISANLDAGSTLDHASKVDQTMEEILKKNPQVQYIYSTVEADQINLTVRVSEKQDRAESIQQIVADMRNSLKSVPGVDLSVLVGGGMIPGKMAQYHMTGPDFTQLREYAVKAEKAMKDTPGAEDVSLSYKAGQPEVTLEVDRDKAADLGVSPASISSTLSTLFNGSDVSHYETAKDRYDVRIQFQESDRNDFSSLQGIYVPSTSGTMVPIEQVTKKVFTTSSSTINRYDKEREIQLSGNYVGGQGAFTSAFQSKLDSEAPTPAGINFSVGGSQEQMGNSIGNLLQMLVLGILFIFLVIAAQFESFLDPFAILLSLPLAIIGAIFGLFLGNQELDMMSAIGVVMLMGLVTKNAILLIDFAKQNYMQGMDLKEALIEAGRTRLRPIIMTALTTVFGMLPTAMANGSGSELRQPMAYAIIGGMITSTLLTLFVVPVMYLVFNNLKISFAKLKKRKLLPEKTGSENLGTEP